jgi:hypothetical protein
MATIVEVIKTIKGFYIIGCLIIKGKGKIIYTSTLFFRYGFFSYHLITNSFLLPKYSNFLDVKTLTENQKIKSMRVGKAQKRGGALV